MTAQTKETPYRPWTAPPAIWNDTFYQTVNVAKSLKKLLGYHCIVDISGKSQHPEYSEISVWINRKVTSDYGELYTFPSPAQFNEWSIRRELLHRRFTL